MNHLAKLAGILAVLSVFAAASAGLSLKSPDELNVTKYTEEDTSSENLTERISYEVKDEPKETDDLRQKIKQRAERVKDRMEDEEKEKRQEESITGASTASKPSKGFFDAIFGIFG